MDGGHYTAVAVEHSTDVGFELSLLHCILYYSTPKPLVLLVLSVSMGKTTIELSETVRDELRRYKAQDGQTYDEAIEDLLTTVGWIDEHQGRVYYNGDNAS